MPLNRPPGGEWEFCCTSFGRVGGVGVGLGVGGTLAPAPCWGSWQAEGSPQKMSHPPLLPSPLLSYGGRVALGTTQTVQAF